MNAAARTALVLGVVALITARGAVQADQTTFTSRADMVAIDALVTDGRSPVSGLRAEDFEVRDNGVLQRVALVSQGQVPLQVVLALDTSGSVNGERLTVLRSAAGAVVTAIHADDRLAIVAFGSRVRWRQLAAATPAAVADVLQPMADPGDTALFDASYTAITLAESEGMRGLAIVFSDGVDTASFLSSGAVLDTARRADVVTFAVAVGASPPPFLGDLTSATGGRTLRVESERALGATLQAIVDEFRSRYLISYALEGVPRAGWHRLDVRVKGRKLDVNARPGYMADAVAP